MKNTNDIKDSSSAANQRHPSSRGVSALSIVAVVFTCMLFTTGCQSSNKVKGSAIGASSGAVLGGLIGSQSDNTAVGAILGAGVGGAAGALIGDRMDKQAEELKRDLKGTTVERIGEGIKITFNSGLMFDFDSDALRAETKQNLDELASTLTKYDDTDVVIEGHTDKVGSEDYNLTLSQKRARAVADYLTLKHVKAKRIRATGYGETQPISTADEQNRRVEVAIIANKKMKRMAEKGDL